MCRGENARTRSSNVRGAERTVLCLIDAIRRAHGLQALHGNRALEAVARAEVRGMLHGDYFAEVSPSGQTPLQLIAASGYIPRGAGATVAQDTGWGTGADTTPASIVAAWMASPPHRANILSDAFRDAGVAVSARIPRSLGVGHHGATFVFEFGARIG
jgi:uncharacterized protein YkwD